MPFGRTRLVAASRILGLALALTAIGRSTFAACRSDQRLVTVADSIEMTEIATPSQQSGADPVALFSPDGLHFAIVLTKGDLGANTNVYTLMIFATRVAPKSRRPEAVVTMASNSNLPAISDLVWLKNSRTLLFLGEKPNSPAQIYSFSIVTKKLRALTHHPRSIVSYSASDDAGTIVFEADPAPVDIVRTPRTLRDGFVVDGQELTSILFSGYRNRQSMDFMSRDLFVQVGPNQPKKVALEDAVWPLHTLSVAPDGRYALVEAYARRIPPEWTRYGSGVFHVYVTAQKSPSALSVVETYLLLDTRTGSLSTLLGTPKEWWHDGFQWLDRGRSLILSNSYLPVEGVSQAEQREREDHPSVVEIELPSKKFTQIDREQLNASSWNEATNQLTLVGRGTNANIRKVYQRHDSRWVLEPRAGDSIAPKQANPAVGVEQGMNKPPTIWIFDPESKQSVPLLDPNPQFSHLCFAEEKEIKWKGTDGQDTEGGLYLPPDYVPGQRYPLVIQTHAFDPSQFWIDGPWHSGYAAQALAARGIAVLQMGYSHTGRSTPSEAPGVMASLEGAIDSLDQQGIVDPNHVGLLGFSRTVFHVAYTLTHSKDHFAAATLADGVDGGYFQTIAFGEVAAPDAIAVNGGPPWGESLREWIERSPLFNVGAVSAPLRLESYGMNAALGLWGWYSLLSRRKMPVEMIVLPDAPHLLVKPWERMASQQGNVDWFAFWLKGEMDPEPSKADQYTRWQRLRSLQEESGQAVPDTPSPRIP